METLPTLAEVAVALAGFASIVVLFKRRESGRWARPDVGRFTGMVMHAAIAVTSSLLPLVLGAFELPDARLWGVCSAMLAAMTAVQVLLAYRAEVAVSSTGRVWLSVALPGFAVSLVLLANASGIAWAPFAGPYVAGVAWHVLHSLMLFVALVAIGRADIEP